MDVKHEKSKNVSVVTYNELSELKNANPTNTTVCVDEIHMNSVNPEDLHAIQAKSFWIHSHQGHRPKPRKSRRISQDTIS
jgi:hypothetical protein